MNTLKVKGIAKLFKAAYKKELIAFRDKEIVWFKEYYNNWILELWKEHLIILSIKGFISLKTYQKYYYADNRGG